MGLSKPVIITSSAVDTSNLATKSDLTALSNTVTSSAGGGVKSIQKVFIPSASLSSDNGGSLNYRYSDYTISAVDVNKSYIIGAGRASAPPPSCEFISSTKVRVYGNYYSSGNYSLYGMFTVIETK